MDINILVWLAIVGIIYVIYVERTAQKKLKKFFREYKAPTQVMVESKSPVGTPKVLTNDEKETLKILLDVIKKHELDYMESTLVELSDDDLIKELINDVKDDLKEVVNEDDNDEVLNETIQEVIKEMTPPDTIAIVGDAEVALQKLGYKKLQIRKAIAGLDIAHKTASEIVTQSLTILNK